MTRYMLIETFRENCLQQAYDRFHERGRMLPEGLDYLDSWLTADGARCFQLMETDRHDLLREWMKNWDDLVSFEVFELGAKPGKHEDSQPI